MTDTHRSGRTRHHVCQSIRGALVNWTRREWRDALGWIRKDDGSPFTEPDDLKNAFIDEIKKGHEVIPLSGDCEGFDYSGHGCPGHPVQDEVAP